MRWQTPSASHQPTLNDPLEIPRQATSLPVVTAHQSEPRRIRVGIMCLGKKFPLWQAETIKSLLEIPEAEISLLIVKRAAPGTSGWSRLLHDPGHLLWNLYNKGFVQRRSAASRSVDLSTELSAVDEVTCQTIPVGKYGEALSDEDLNTVQSHNLDLILRFSFGILKGDVLESAKYGIWSFHHGDERVYRGQPPGFWELVDGQPTVGTILQRITERLDGGTVLHRGRFRATSHSYRRTRDEAFLGATDFPSIAVRQILAGDESVVTANPSTTDAPLRRSPGNLQMVSFFLKQMVAFVHSQWRGLTKASKWSVGIGQFPVSQLLDDDDPQFEWAPDSGATRYLADPFLDPTGDSSVVLVEDYDHSTHRGVISAVDMAGDRTPRTVLDTGVHASYPFLLHHEGYVYCVPETYQADEVRVYRTSNFPEDWELASTMLEGRQALDPTLFLHDGFWWLFCTFEGKHSNTKLHAFYSDNPFGPWTPHLLNPVKTDVTSSRPGGTPFMHNGELYRPAQDSSESYGGALAINRVDDLTPEKFSETTVRRVGPLKGGPYRSGIHTVSGNNQITIVDGRRDRFVMSSFRRELAGRLKRISKE